MYTILRKLKHLVIFFLLTILVCCNFGCAKDSPAGNAHSTNEENKIADKRLEKYQEKLLDTAFKTATSVPSYPFKKMRARIQQQVVESCLKLDLPVRSVKYADKIENWRKGMCYAHTSYYLAKEGFGLAQIKEGINLAEKIAKIDHGQKWRSERIKVRIAQTYRLLGEKEKANDLLSGVDDLNDHSKEKADISDDQNTPKEATFEERLSVLEANIKMNNFNINKMSLFSIAQLYKEFYKDQKRRELAENAIKSNWDNLPIRIRFDVLVAMINISLDNSDNAKALKLIDECKTFFDDYSWGTDNLIPLKAKLADLTYRAGNAHKARTYIDSAYADYKENKSKIEAMYRPETIIPVAEVYKLLKDSETALTVYKEAVEQSFVNPNRQQNADDLAAVCCSMAVTKTRPDNKLMQRIDEISSKIIQSWK